MMTASWVCRRTDMEPFWLAATGALQFKLVFALLGT